MEKMKIEIWISQWAIYVSSSCNWRKWQDNTEGPCIGNKEITVQFGFLATLNQKGEFNNTYSLSTS